MYADRKLIERLLFDTEISSAEIARVAGFKSATAIKKFRSGESNIDNMRLGNAEALTLFAEETFYPKSEKQEKIDWLLNVFSENGENLSYNELIQKMTDNYYELVKGNFIDVKQK